MSSSNTTLPVEFLGCYSPASFSHRHSWNHVPLTYCPTSLLSRIQYALVHTSSSAANLPYDLNSVKSINSI